MIGEKIGEGRTAKIFAWENDGEKVIKLFHPTYDYFGVWEAKLNELISGFGLPIPTYFETVEWTGQTGLIFERINGMTLADGMIKSEDSVADLLRKMAAVQVQICSHLLKNDALPTMKDSYRQRVIESEDLSAVEKKFLYARLDDLADGDFLCHADFHPDNILVEGDDWFVIDWLTASRGCLEADVARTLVTIRYGLITFGVESGEMETAMKFSAYFDDYAKLVSEIADFDFDLLEKWMPVILAGRLQENNSKAEHDAILRDLRDFLE